ncbi:MAG: glycosyl hydrolase, partial [Bacteroidota bacterium]
GLQDNGVWMGKKTYREGFRWQSTGQYPYKSIMGGDGMQIQIDNRDNTTVYTGYQFGNYFRINTRSGKRKYITPKQDLGDRPYRFNWQSPILLSPHNQDIFYLGAHKLLRSMDQGDSFKEISEDLTMGGQKGDVAYGTLTSIDESIFEFGLIYTGSDDGKVMRTKDGGNTWDEIMQGLPSDLWVTRVQASKHEESRVYLALNGYRWDNFAPYVYMSDDYGDTWKAIHNNLPNEPVNVIKEDPINEDILYVGTDHGLYISIDQGNSFMMMNNGIPNVPVHDIVIHERDQELLIGTHGRSIYLADIKALQALDDELLNKAIYAFEPGSMYYNSNWGNKPTAYREANVPTLNLQYYTNSNGNVTMQVFHDDHMLHETSFDAKKGINLYEYDLSMDPKRYDHLFNKLKKKDTELTKAEVAENGTLYLTKGNYIIKLIKDSNKHTVNIEIK